MAKLDRKDVKIFAENSKETLITEFRTEDSQGSTASFSRDPDVIQNENYSQGWVNDTNNLNTKIYGEDLNAVNYVLSYLLKYLYENGIAEWKSTTTYYQNSICKVDNALYLSLQNNNIGNDPTSTVSYWKLIPLENVSIEDAGSGFSIVKDVTDNVITFKTISVTGYGEITDNGDQLNIDIAGGGGGGGGDTYWGTIRGTITNQTDLISLINLKQDIFTVDSPLVLTDEQHLTINKATSSVSGYLDYNDFNTFNGKQDTISATLPISITNNNIEIATANTSTTGALSYTDWNTFNNKQDAINGLTITETSTTFDVVPKSSITTSNIGSSTYPFSSSYIDNIKTDQISGITTSTVVNTAADILPTVTNTYDLGSSSKTFADGYINNTISNTVTTDEIAPKTTVTPNPNNPEVTTKSVVINNFELKKWFDSNSNQTAVDISSTVPVDANNIATLGFYRKFNSIKADTLLANSEVVTASIAPTTGNTSINISSNISPGTNNTYKIGTSNSNYFSESYIRKMYVGEIHMGSGNTSTVWLYTGNDIRFENESSSGTVNVYSGQSGTSNLGTNGHKWNNVWTEKINGSNYSPSDRDKKENINKRSDETKGKKTSLEIVSNLDTYTYNYKDDKGKTIHIGIMAQDLQNEVPECVVDNGEDNKKGEYEKDLYIDVMGYVTILTEAVKQLNAKVEALEARVNELEGNKKELEK